MATKYMTRYQVPYLWEKRGVENSDLAVEVPGSKSITNRALLLAALAKGKSALRGMLFSEDSRYFLICLQGLGFETKVDEQAKVVEICGTGGILPKSEATVYVGSAGTAARFLAAWLGVSNGIYHMDASQQMRRRPMAPLLETLKDIGCKVACTEKEGFFPFTLHGKGFGKQGISINIDHSSQFLSGLLMVAPLSSKTVEIQVEGNHGLSYIEMTRRMMERCGVKVGALPGGKYMIEEGQEYHPLDYQIEPDVSAACYFYALALLLGNKIMVKHVFFDSLQGDVEFLRILEKMGGTLEETSQGISLTGKFGAYQGITADMSACSDQAITLAALAPFATTPTTITGIGHIRYQESDRIHAIATELERMGIHCEERQDSITIYPGQPKSSVVQTYEDHRMAMGFSLIGLRAQGIVIDNPQCCKKTFENYFEVLNRVVGSLL